MATDEDVRCCWVCYDVGESETDPENAADSPGLEDNPLPEQSPAQGVGPARNPRTLPYSEWVQPCSCRGSSQWVHQSCLQKWVDVMQKGNINRKIACPQCKTEYILVFPSMGILVTILDAIEEITHKICPFITGGVLLGSIYWTAITYGAVTVMQVLGHNEGLQMLEAADPIMLLLFLPAVPAALICERALHWEDIILRALHTSYRGFYTVSQNQFSSGRQVENRAENRAAVNTSGVTLRIGGNSSPTRILCSALVLPTMSTLLGKIFFTSVRSNLHRAALGGLTFLLLRGAVTIYHKQKLLVRQSSRKILDYTEKNLRLYANGVSSVQPGNSSNTYM